MNLHGGYHLRGTLDELALYRRALGASEILNHYANGLVGIGIAGGTTPPEAPQITSAVPPGTGTVGTPYNYTVTATETAPITFTASGLPNGLTISTAGAISGTPLTAGTFNGTITAANGTLPNATQPFSIVISAPISAFVSDDFSSGVLNSGLWTFVDPVGDSTPLIRW